MTLDADRYARVHGILSRARLLAGAELDAFLDAACDGDEELRAAVLELLEAGREGAAFATEPSGRVAHGLGAMSDVEPDGLPDEVGGYRILRLLGRGGMGVVYEAEQASPRRRVALKVMNPVAASAGALSRFRREAELLGRLQHPGVAQIIEASTFDAGRGPQPFFAMELVDGMPLTDYVEAHELDVDQRLELVARICDVLEYAHQRGIVHRDLKPANILVTSAESSSGERAAAGALTLARPKILDFGVARATDLDLAGTAHRTIEGQLLGTVAYMSPEQAAGQPELIDARSDVYALGVLAYELLAGRLPHVIEATLLHEALRAIREDDPEPLSSVDGSLRGDVETIVGKALEKEKERRYGSAAALAADIRRYLADQPITARPPTTAYQLRKFAKRNKVLVAGLGGTFAALVVGLAGTLYFLFESREQTELAREQEGLAKAQAEIAREQTERARASEEAERLAAQRAEAVNDFLVKDLLGAAAPDRDGYEAKVVDVLARAEANAGARFGDDPLLEGEIRSTLADTYVRLGLFSEAEAQGRLAIELLPAGSETALWSQVTLGRTLRELGNLDESLELSERLAEEARTRLGPDHGTTLLATSNVGHALQALGRHEEALPILEECVASLERVAGPLDEGALGTRSAIVGSLLAQGRNEEALAVSTELCARVREGYGPDHPVAIAVPYNHVTLLMNTGDFEAAAALAKELYEQAVETLPPGHNMIASTALSCGSSLARSGNPAAGAPYVVEAYALFAAIHSEESFSCEVTTDHLIGTYGLLGDQEQVERWRRCALRIRLTIGGEGEIDLAVAKLQALEALLREQGRGDVADLPDELASDAEERFPAGDWRRVRFLTNLGCTLVRIGRHAEARPFLLRAHEAPAGEYEELLREDRGRIARALPEVYDALGDPGEAERWASETEEGE